MRNRVAALNNIEKNSFDLCVIGGGATGAGCALDAQLRGLRTVLVEAGDFACATSSSSTKLIHGGVRYLEQAISERDLGQYHVGSMAPRKRVAPGKYSYNNLKGYKRHISDKNMRASA